jgi:hypothetical protein
MAEGQLIRDPAADPYDLTGLRFIPADRKSRNPHSNIY